MKPLRPSERCGVIVAQNNVGSDGEPLSVRKALALMQAQPSLIKRPVLEYGAKKPLVGFKPEIYADALAG